MGNMFMGLHRIDDVVHHIDIVKYKLMRLQTIFDVQTRINIINYREGDGSILMTPELRLDQIRSLQAVSKNVSKIASTNKSPAPSQSTHNHHHHHGSAADSKKSKKKRISEWQLHMNHLFLFDLHYAFRM